MKLRTWKPKQGPSPLALIGGAIVIVAIVLLVVWLLTANHTSPKSSSASSSTSTANTDLNACTAKLHDSDLCKFEIQMAAAPLTKQPYSATISVTANGTSHSMQYSQDGKGSRSVTSSGGPTFIEINGVTYAQNGKNLQKSTSAQLSQAIGTDPDSDLAFTTSVSATTFTKAGSDSCGKLLCLKYKVGGASTEYIWFDTTNYQLQKFSMSGSPAVTMTNFSYSRVSS